MGILAGPDSETSLETADSSIYSTRVAEILGTRHNGVWSTQAESLINTRFTRVLWVPVVRFRPSNSTHLYCDNCS